MSVFDRDRLVEALSMRERAAEDIFFGRRDEELIARMRDRTVADAEERTRELARMRCPDCGRRLAPVNHRGIETEECPAGHGIWVKPDELYEIPVRERDSWFARWYPYTPR